MEGHGFEDHSIPNANITIFWKWGSRNEIPWNSGLSPFLRHIDV